MPNTADQWMANKGNILNAMSAGNATPQQKAWYDRWVSAGSPASQQGMWAALESGGAPPPPAEMNYDQRTQQGYIDRGVIDRYGNILNPNGINTATLVRNTPSWAQGNEALLRNAYLNNFEAQARNGNVGWDTADSNDYRGFTGMGFELTPEERQRIGAVAGQDMGYKDSLTFGGGQTTTGVANPQPTSPSQGAGGTADPFADFGVDQYQMATRGASTPFMDSYLRSRDAARATGPVSGLFAKELGEQQ